VCVNFTRPRVVEKKSSSVDLSRMCVDSTCSTVPRCISIQIFSIVRLRFESTRMRVIKKTTPKKQEAKHVSGA
jgi:hypothetical protein